MTKLGHTTLYIMLDDFASEYTAGRIYIYSVMESDRNSLCGDVVLDTFSTESRDEDTTY